MIHSHRVADKLVGCEGDPPSDAEVWRAIVAAGKEQSIVLPASYSKDSEMNIAPPRFTDTTDRSLARRLGAKRIELLKLYYSTPFLTCKKCNTLLFSGATCEECESSIEYSLGAKDFLKQIAQSKEELLCLIRIRKAAAKTLGRAYRYYLRRAYGRAQRREVLVLKLLKDWCASAIASCARGRLGRRKASTVRRLRKIIEPAHPLSLKKALKGDGDIWGAHVPQWFVDRTLAEDAVNAKKRRKKVFWYHSSQQLKLLYDDYVELCARLGFMPSRSEVEANIAEIARRIELREGRLVTAVQAKWRARTVRMLLLGFYRERANWRETRAAAAFKLCRIIRKWMICRSVVAHRRAEVVKAKLAEDYRAYRRRDTRSLESRKVALKAAYIKERAEERTARYCGLVHPGGYYGKMHAYSASPYCSSAVVDAALLMNRERGGGSGEDCDNIQCCGFQRRTSRPVIHRGEDDKRRNPRLAKLLRDTAKARSKRIGLPQLHQQSA